MNYKYLNQNDNRDPSTVVLQNCTDTSIIIRDEFNNNYKVFDTWDMFWTFVDSIPIQERCFHEVIMGKKPQKIKFDLDVELNKLNHLTLQEIETITNISYNDEFDDLDNINESILESKVKMYIILKYILSIILDQMYIQYFESDNIIITTKSFVILDSSGYTSIEQSTNQYKFSYHIILTSYAVSNYEEAKYISTNIYNNIHKTLQFVFDIGVNKSIQNFRLIDSTKPNQSRFLKSTSDDDLYNVDIATRKNSVICPTVMPTMLTNKYNNKHINSKLSDDYIDEAVKLVCKAAEENGLLDAHQFRDVSNMLFMFNRIYPSMCNICKRVHDNDNTLMITLKYNSGIGIILYNDDNYTNIDELNEHGTRLITYNIVELCRHAPATESNVISTIKIDSTYIDNIIPLNTILPDGSARRGESKESKETKTQVKSLSAIKKRLTDISTNQANIHQSNYTEMEKMQPDFTNIYNLNTMQSYELKPTLVVKAQMKMGKTKALKDYIDRYFISTGSFPMIQPIITWLTFRQTFSKSIQSTFTDFISYADINGEINQNRYNKLIIQVESLFRIQMNYQPDPIDLLILDEVESIFEQFNSGLHKKFNVNFAIFKWMISTAKYVICMDANISDRTYNTLKNLRPNHQIFFHWNTFKRAADDKYYICTTRNLWMSKLYDLLDNNNKVVIPINSYTEAVTIEEILQNKYKNKKIKLYSSKTSALEKNKHFSDVHTYWSELDILIYTPTVSAGISYELEHFNAVFGYFTDKSCNVESCRQMLGRIRNIKSLSYYIYLCGQGNTLPTYTKDIKKQLYDSRTNLYKKLDNNLALSFEFDKHGKIEYHESAYFNLWLENKRIENLSKNYFVRRFIDQVADSGAQIHELDTDIVESELKTIGYTYKTTQSMLKDRSCEFIAMSSDIEYDEFKEIKDKMDKQLDITKEEYGKYYKHKLQLTYNWFDKPIDKQFVADYNYQTAILIYKNLKIITTGTTILESLNTLKAHEMEHNQILLYTDPILSDGSTRINSETKQILDIYSNDSCESKDLHYNYVFQKHYLTVWMVNMIGFDEFILGIFRMQMIHTDDIYTNIMKHESEFINKLDTISYEFKDKQIDKKTISGSVNQALHIKRVISIVNKYLRRMYGMEITKVLKKDHIGKYYIKNNANGKLFKIVPYNINEEDLKLIKVPYILSKQF